MADFTPINTQEEFDARIKDRLEREVKKYESQIAELTEKATKLDEQTSKLADLQSELDKSKVTIKGYETSSVKMRIAHETGLPYEMAERLRGDDEKAIREDAEAMKKYIGKPRSADPDFNPDTAGAKGDTRTAAFKSMLSSLKGE